MSHMSEGAEPGRDDLTTAGVGFAREVAQLFMAGRRSSMDLGTVPQAAPVRLPYEKLALPNS